MKIALKSLGSCLQLNLEPGAFILLFRAAASQFQVQLKNSCESEMWSFTLAFGYSLAFIVFVWVNYQRGTECSGS